VSLFSILCNQIILLFCKYEIDLQTLLAYNLIIIILFDERIVSPFGLASHQVPHQHNNELVKCLRVSNFVRINTLSREVFGPDI